MYIALSSEGSQYESYSVQTTEDQREIELNHMLDEYTPVYEEKIKSTHYYEFNGVIYD